jgi:hypothetical protein
LTEYLRTLIRKGSEENAVRLTLPDDVIETMRTRSGDAPPDIYLQGLIQKDLHPNTLFVELSDEEKTRIDSLRGDKPRDEYLRKVIMTDRPQGKPLELNKETGKEIEHLLKAEIGKHHKVTTTTLSTISDLLEERLPHPGWRIDRVPLEASVLRRWVFFFVVVALTPTSLFLIYANPWVVHRIGKSFDKGFWDGCFALGDLFLWFILPPLLAQLVWLMFLPVLRSKNLRNLFS